MECLYRGTLALLFGCLCWQTSECKSAREYSTAVTVQPKNGTVGANCFPFNGHSYDFAQVSFWPFIGFIYKDVDSFTLRRGDMIAFDMVRENDRDIVMDIDVAPTVTNGGKRNNGPFTTVVRSGKASSRGDRTWGNFDLKFEVNADEFHFGGGGIILRFSAKGVFAGDKSCVQGVATTNIRDPSGHFVWRFIRDSDGLPPWIDALDNSTKCSDYLRPLQDCEFDQHIPPFRILLAEKFNSTWIKFRPRKRVVPEGTEKDKAVARLFSNVTGYNHEALCNLTTDGPFVLRRHFIRLTEKLDYETSPKGGFKVRLRCEDGGQPRLARLDQEHQFVIRVSNVLEYPRTIILSPLPIESKLAISHKSCVLGNGQEDMELPEDLAPAQPIMNITVQGQDPDVDVDLRVFGEDSYFFDIIDGQLYLRHQLDKDFRFLYVSISATINGQGVTGKIRGKVLPADDCNTGTRVCGVNAECVRYGRTDTRCLCKAGFEADQNGNCWLIDFCRSSPCAPNGACNNSKQGFQCHCNQSWYGKKCEHLGVPCGGRLCRNGAGCATDSVNGDSVCLCHGGFSGSKCEIPPTPPTSRPTTRWSPTTLPLTTVVRTTVVTPVPTNKSGSQTSLWQQYSIFIAGFGGGILIIVLLLILIVVRHKHIVRRNEKQYRAQQSSSRMPQRQDVVRTSQARWRSESGPVNAPRLPRSQQWPAIAQKLVSPPQVTQPS